MKMYKANSLAAFLKNDLKGFSWEDDIFDSDEESVAMGKKTRVRFCDTVSTREITCISDMEISEIDDLWYTHKDFNAMKAECRELVTSIVSSRIKTSADMCLRGLEEKLYRSQKKINRSEAIGAVLDEQDAQFGYGEPCAEMIAQAYHEFAAHCVDDAIELAKRDQAAALAIHGLSSSPSSLKSNRKSSEIQSTATRTLLVA